MRHRIFTKNNYIKFAFRHLLREISFERYTCIIDIDSYTSFSELLDEIDGVELRTNQRIYILTGISVHSKILSSLATFGRDNCLDDIKQLLKSGQTISWPDFKRHLIMLLELSMMSKKERKIAWALYQHPDVSSVAELANVNNKTIYSYIAIIARKLNLRYLNEVRMFIASEMNYIS